MKKETLEEFIESQPYYGTCTYEYKEGIEVGANWQKERMYSEEEVRKILWELGDVLFNNCQKGIKEGEPEQYIDLIIEQFKK